MASDTYLGIFSSIELWPTALQTAALSLVLRLRHMTNCIRILKNLFCNPGNHMIAFYTALKFTRVSLTNEVPIWNKLYLLEEENQFNGSILQRYWVVHTKTFHVNVASFALGSFYISSFKSMWGHPFWGITLLFQISSKSKSWLLDVCSFLALCWPK